jgi:hypothetical protein
MLTYVNTNLYWVCTVCTILVVVEGEDEGEDEDEGDTFAISKTMANT